MALLGVLKGEEWPQMLELLRYQFENLTIRKLSARKEKINLKKKLPNFLTEWSHHIPLHNIAFQSTPCILNLDIACNMFDLFKWSGVNAYS